MYSWYGDMSVYNGACICVCMWLVCVGVCEVGVVHVFLGCVMCSAMVGVSVGAV